MELRKIIRENHNQKLIGIQFNRVTEKAKELVLSASPRQLNLYDNNHLGGHLDLMCHYAHPPESAPITSAAWVDPHQDAVDTLVVFGCQDGQLGVLSVCRTRVIAVVPAHSGAVTGVRAVDSHSGHVLSWSGAVVRLWSVRSPLSLVASFVCPSAASPVQSALYHEASGSLLVAAGRHVLGWMVPRALWSRPSDAAAVEFGAETATAAAPRPQDPPVEWLGTAAGGHVVSKTREGRVTLWTAQATGYAAVQSFRIHGARPDGGLLCDVNVAGMQFACGNADYEVLVYDLFSARLLSRLSHRRCRSVATSCSFSPSGDVLLTSSLGMLLRWSAFSSNLPSPDDHTEEEADW